MADISKVVELVFQGVDKTGAAISSALGSLEKGAQGLQNITGPIASATEKILLMEAAVAAIAVAFGKTAFDAAVKFESAQIDLAKVLSDSEGPVENYTQIVLELSNKYGESSTNILQSIANFKQAGFTAGEAVELTKAALDLVIAGDIEAAEASDLLVASLKGFGVEAKEAAHLNEVLNATSNSYATNVKELAQGMAALSPIADKMGLSFEETAGVLTPVIEVFRSGEEAGTALKTGLLKLLDDSKPVQDALKSIGVSQHDANGKLREGKDILYDVAKSFNTLDEAQKLAFTAQLVGLDQSARMVEVFQSLADKSVDVNKAMRESTTVSEEVAIRLASTEKTIAKTTVAFENLKIAIGNEFKAELKGVIDGFGEIFRVLESEVSSGALDKFFAGFTPHLKELERIAREVAAVLPKALEDADFSGFSRGFETLFGSLRDVSVDSEDLKGIIEGLGKAFETLANFTNGVIKAIEGVVSVVWPVVEGFGDLDSETQKLIGQIGLAAIVFGKIAEPLTNILGLLGNIKLAGGLAGLFKDFDIGKVDAIKGAIGGLAGATGIGLLAFELTRLTGADKALNDVLAPDWLFGEGATVGTVAADAAEKLGLLGEKTQALVPIQSEEERQLQKLIDETNAYLDATKITAETEEQRAAISDRLTNVFKEQGYAYDAATGELKKLSDVQAETTAQIKEAEDAARGWKVEIVDGMRVYSQVGPAFADSNKEVKKTADEMKEAAKQAHELQLKMLELASDERIALIEAKVKLNVAELEAQTEQVKAAFASIDTTISSTGDLLGELFGQFADVQAGYQRTAIERQIDLENKRRDEALQLQRDLTEAQLENLRERTRQIKRGDAVIKVEAQNLEPALEMIFFEVLRKVQIEANSQGVEMLLGIPPAGP